MKVAQFIIGSHGGAERFYVKLLTALRDYDVEQHAIHNDHPRLIEAVQTSGVPATVIPFAKGADRAGRARYRDALASVQPDIVMHWMNRAARRAEFGPHINIGRLGGFYPVRYYWRCDHVIANTPQIHDDILRQGWPAHAAHMLSNFGELTPRPAASRSSLGVPDNAFILLAMGRFDPWKSFDVLISALKYLPPNVFLCLAGDGGEAVTAEFHALAARENVADRVRFLGWRNDQAALLGACDLCVVPSSHEPLGNVILEAWSLKVPVVAAASEGPSWLISHGETGLLCQPLNAQDLAAKIREAHDNPDLLARMAGHGHDKWASSFSKDVICRQYIAFFKDITENRRSPSMRARMTRMLKGLASRYTQRAVAHNTHRPATRA
jgi:glycosyltransferase involved in cell wall biosynthesis